MVVCHLPVTVPFLLMEVSHSFGYGHYELRCSDIMINVNKKKHIPMSRVTKTTTAANIQQQQKKTNNNNNMT